MAFPSLWTLGSDHTVSWEGGKESHPLSRPLEHCAHCVIVHPLSGQVRCLTGPAGGPHTRLDTRVVCLAVGVEGRRHDVPGLCVLWLNTYGFDVGEAAEPTLEATANNLRRLLKKCSPAPRKETAFMGQFSNCCLFGVVMSDPGEVS